MKAPPHVVRLDSLSADHPCAKNQNSVVTFLYTSFISAYSQSARLRSSSDAYPCSQLISAENPPKLTCTSSNSVALSSAMRF